MTDTSGYSLLGRVDTPAELRALPVAELPRLAAELRRCLIETLGRNGGHFAANLGTVELGIALHCAFDTPHDRLVWDVGHQAYPHKMLTGRRGGLSKGKGGSMHMFSKEKNFYGGHGIVGAQVSLGTGLGFANHYRGNGQVACAFFGDGAANQGQVYESFNMAALWKLPVIYVVENNRYAMGTSVSRSSAQTDFSQRGVSFNIPGIQVDGMDVRAVKAATDEAAEHARSGKGPMIMEMLTYRYRGHSMSDPAKYRSKDEVQKMRSEHDPIEQVRLRLLDKKWATEDDLKAIDKDVRDIVADAADFAQADKEPDVSELYTDILLEA